MYYYKYKILNLLLACASVNMRGIDVKKSVQRCYSLIDNTSERWTKLKKMQINMLNNFNYLITIVCFFNDTKRVFCLCLKLGELFGLDCLALGIPGNRRQESLHSELI